MVCYSTLSPSESPSGSLGENSGTNCGSQTYEPPGLLCSQEQRLNQNNYLIRNKQNKGCWQRGRVLFRLQEQQLGILAG